MLRVLVHSRVKPKSSITFTCRPGEADKALVGAGAAAETCNERFGDNMDPKHAIACVKQFFSECPAMKCRTCGYRNKETGKCNMHGHTFVENGTCPQYRHEFVVKDDCDLNEGIIK